MGQNMCIVLIEYLDQYNTIESMGFILPREKRKEKIFCAITYTDLERLFSTNRRTIQRWIQKGVLDPTDILDIIEKYNNPSLLDRRKGR